MKSRRSDCKFIQITKICILFALVLVSYGLEDKEPDDLVDDKEPDDLVDEKKPGDPVDDKEPADIIDEKGPADLVDGSSCTKLTNPPHGEFQCKPEKEGEKCVLTCLEGYNLPITEYRHDHQHVPLQERGVYRCTKTPGGLTWLPNLFFDCIYIVHPANFLFYFGLILDPFPRECLNDYGKKLQLSRMTPNTKDGNAVLECMQLLGQSCYWTFDMACVDGIWEMDAWFRIPYSYAIFETYEEWEPKIKKAMTQDTLEQFVLSRQKNATITNRQSFSFECPRATRLEQDYTCRGCSKGYYMYQGWMECLPCPANKYQDEDFGYLCKTCPKGNTQYQTGLKSMIECYHFSHWEESTSVIAILVPIGSVVAVSSVILAFRSQVLNEPDGRHREIYQEPEFYGGGGGRLQRIMRALTAKIPRRNQFDSMRISIKDEYLEKSLLDSGMQRRYTKTGKSILVSKKRPSNERWSSGYSYDSGFS